MKVMNGPGRMGLEAVLYLHVCCYPEFKLFFIAFWQAGSLTLGYANVPLSRYVNITCVDSVLRSFSQTPDQIWVSKEH